MENKKAQPEQEIESDRPHVEDDGCPTEKAVLQRFWREHHAQPEPEPVAWVYQHGDTGLTMCVLVQQVESGFEKNNPRWQKSTPLYTAPINCTCNNGEK